MKPERNEDFSEELLALLGEEAFVALVERHGGEKIFVPSVRDSAELVATLGAEAAAKLQRVHGGNKVNIPLARALRARKYRGDGMSDREIARALGMTVSGVERLFRRMPDRPARRGKRKPDPRQMRLFE